MPAFSLRASAPSLRRRARGVALVLGLLAVAQPAAAQDWEDYDYENLEFRAVGGSVGALLLSRVDDAISFGLHADLGLLGPQVRISPSLAFWSSSLRQDRVDRLARQLRVLCLRQYEPDSCRELDLGAVRFSDLSANVDAHYLLPEMGAVAPYAGGGVGLHFLNGSGAAIDDTFVEDFLDTVSPGLNLIAGASTRALAPFGAFAEARFVLAPDVRYAVLAVGAFWDLPRSSGRPGAPAVAVPVLAPAPR